MPHNNMNAKYFKNSSQEQFIGVWNKKKTIIEPGEKVLLEGYLADHFAKHFVDRELTKNASKTNAINDRKKILAECLQDAGINYRDEDDFKIKIGKIDGEKDNEISKLKKELKNVKSKSKDKTPEDDFEKQKELKNNVKQTKITKKESKSKSSKDKTPEDDFDGMNETTNESTNK